VLSLRYDALVFIDESYALDPWPVAIDDHGGAD
jgi:hypothetical protein